VALLRHRCAFLGMHHGPESQSQSGGRAPGLPDWSKMMQSTWSRSRRAAPSRFQHVALI
jgi:hypothetical protein